jgi:hypothetical protein
MADQLDFGLIVLDPQAHKAQMAKQKRRCLSCERTFESSGSGNRICNLCKNRDAWSSPIEFAVSSAAF